MGKINRRELGKGMVASMIGSALAPVMRGAAQGTGPSSVVQLQSAGPGIWRATIGTPEAYTPVKSRLVESKMDTLRALPAVSNTPLGEIRGEVTARGTMLRLPLAPREGVYGFGLQLLSFAQRGKKKTTRVNADPRVDSGDTHAPVPFYVTTAGYGVLVDTARYAAFYSGDAHEAPPTPANGTAADRRAK